MDIPEENNECFNNLCNENGMKICTRCRAAWYCSKECQVQHWKRHKKCCKMISSNPEMSLKYIKATKDYDSALCLRNECQEDHWRKNNSIKYSKRGKSYRIDTHHEKNGELDQALLSYQESLEVFQEFQDDFFISSCYYEIGNVLLSKGQYEEALVNYRKALEIFREIHGEKHCQTAACYEWIGNVLGYQGRYDDALIGYGKALAIRMKIFGENHLETAISYYNIGAAQLNKGDYGGALISLEKAKTIYTCELGVEHSETVQANACIDLCQQYIDLSNEAVQL